MLGDQLFEVAECRSVIAKRPTFGDTASKNGGGQKMAESKPHAHRLRSGRHSLAGLVYMVTVVTLERQKFFDNFVAARTLIHALRAESERQQASTLAFVVMPDHVHWLMQLEEGAALAQCVRRVKAVTTYRLGHPVWQRGYHDHAVRHDEDLKALTRYVIANPLRAGLTPAVALYPHWDAIWL